MKISEGIKRQRLKAGLSQAELAERIEGGWSRHRISDYETGRKVPSIKSLLKIAEAFGCSIKNILNGDKK